MSTQTPTSDFSVKIVGRYTSGNERTKILKKEAEIRAVKAILHYKKPFTVVRNLEKDENYNSAMVVTVQKVMNKEAITLVSKKSVIFRINNSNDKDFAWETVNEGTKKCAPVVYSSLCSIVSEQKTHIPFLMTALAILLYGRSRTVNKIQSILGLILDKSGLTKEGMSILHDLGITIASSTIHKKKKQLITEQQATVQRYVKSNIDNSNITISEDQGVHQLKPIEILGDNLDITITPAKMTLSSQRKSLHWFLTMVKEKRVVADDVHVSTAEQQSTSVHDIPTNQWIPSTSQIQPLNGHMAFHVAKVLITHIDDLKPLQDCIPKFITHAHLDKTKEKPVVLNCDLIPESENSSEGMITILQNVHNLAVPYSETDGKVMKRVVFGGDVLTNERAFSAQQAMQNVKEEFKSLRGLIHRPEGLHREMNFLLVSKVEFG